MENVEFRKLDSSYSIDNWYADVYGEFSEGQISEIEEKISKKEYSVPEMSVVEYKYQRSLLQAGSGNVDEAEDPPNCGDGCEGG